HGGLSICRQNTIPPSGGGIILARPRAQCQREERGTVPGGALRASPSPGRVEPKRGEGQSTVSNPRLSHARPLPDPHGSGERSGERTCSTRRVKLRREGRASARGGTIDCLPP